VINDNGGQASASSFTMTVAGGAPSVQPSASFAGAETPGPTAALNANTAYSVGETGPAGYRRSDAADCAGSSLGNGQTKTCTVTNDDSRPILHVIKHVINDNGGQATASQFTMSVIGSSPSPDSFAGDENGTTVHLDAG